MQAVAGAHQPRAAHLRHRQVGIGNEHRGAGRSLVVAFAASFIHGVVDVGAHHPPERARAKSVRHFEARHTLRGGIRGQALGDPVVTHRHQAARAGIQIDAVAPGAVCAALAGVGHGVGHGDRIARDDLGRSGDIRHGQVGGRRKRYANQRGDARVVAGVAVLRHGAGGVGVDEDIVVPLQIARQGRRGVPGIALVRIQYSGLRD